MIINRVSRFYLNNNSYAAANLRTEKSNIFEQLMQNTSKSSETGGDSIQISAEKAAGGSPVLTEAGKNSKGTHVLTDIEKQYLKGKYNVSDLSESEQDSLLTELTNMGALSSQDTSGSRVEYLGPTGVLTTENGSDSMRCKLSGRCNAAE